MQCTPAKQEIRTPVQPAPLDPVTLIVVPGPVAAPDLSHVWVINAQVHVTFKQAKIADFRGSIRVKEETRIEALDVMCANCRRAFEDVSDKDCEAKIDNRHLIGGDQRERAKRKKTARPVTAIVVPGPRIDRRGIDAVLSREA